MGVATLNLGGKKFVVIPASEYRQLKASSKGARNGQRKSRRAMSKQDRGDVAESIRRLKNDKFRPAEEVFRDLGV
jgi:hypothetical protein